MKRGNSLKTIHRNAPWNRPADAPVAQGIALGKSSVQPTLGDSSAQAAFAANALVPLGPAQPVQINVAISTKQIASRCRRVVNEAL